MVRIAAGLLLLIWMAGCSDPQDNPVHQQWDNHASWSFQNSYPTPLNLWDVSAADSLHLWAVGAEMTILCSTDGGVTWKQQHGNGGPNYDFNTVKFTDARQGWAVGSGIWHTADGGDHWEWQDDPTGSYMQGMAVVNSNICYAYTWRGTVLKTIDGGSEWRIVASPSEYIRGIWFTDAATGWIGSMDDSLYHTTDGGASWTGQSVGFEVYCCAFYDELHGWVGGWDGVAYTSDGGSNWNIYHSAPGYAINYGKIIPRGPAEAWASSGYLRHTVDGITWETVALGPHEYPYGMTFSGASRLWVVGGPGYVARSDDNGQSWTTLSSQMWEPLSAVDFVDDQTGWIVGSYGAVLHTTDEGLHWYRQPTPDSTQYHAVDFVDRDFGWAVGQDGAILSTTDGGGSWNKFTTDPYDRLDAVAFADRLNGWAAGYMHYPNYGIYHTSDGGASWTAQDIPVTSDIHALSCTDALHAWASTDRVGILRTTDGGASWVLSRFPVSTAITYSESEGVVFTDNLHGCATFSNYYSGTPGIFRTVDGGVTWTSVMDSSQFTDICFADSLYGFAFGQNRYNNGLWQTWDGGGHWQFLSSYTAAGMKFVKPQSGWLVGGGNIIRHYGY